MKGLLARITIDRLRDCWDRLGHMWFEGQMNVNLFGVRASIHLAGAFDDAIGMAYQEPNGHWRLLSWPATTDPGRYYLEHPLNAHGAAILCPGQYRGVYRAGMHRGKYRALVQSKPMRVYRDNDRDAQLEWSGDVREGLYGINLHHAGALLRETIGKSSAGCQVVQDKRDHDVLMHIYDLSTHYYGPSITYTLVTEDELCAG